MIKKHRCWFYYLLKFALTQLDVLEEAQTLRHHHFIMSLLLLRWVLENAGKTRRCLIFFLAIACVFFKSAVKIPTPTLGLGIAQHFWLEALSFFDMTVFFFNPSLHDRTLLNLSNNSKSFWNWKCSVISSFVVSFFRW